MVYIPFDHFARFFTFGTKTLLFCPNLESTHLKLVVSMAAHNTIGSWCNIQLWKPLNQTFEKCINSQILQWPQNGQHATVLLFFFKNGHFIAQAIKLLLLVEFLQSNLAFGGAVKYTNKQVKGQAQMQRNSSPLAWLSNVCKTLQMHPTWMWLWLDNKYSQTSVIIQQCWVSLWETETPGDNKYSFYFLKGRIHHQMLFTNMD